MSQFDCRTISDSDGVTKFNISAGTGYATSCALPVEALAQDFCDEVTVAIHILTTNGACQISYVTLSIWLPNVSAFFVIRCLL